MALSRTGGGLSGGGSSFGGVTSAGPVQNAIYQPYLPGYTTTKGGMQYSNVAGYGDLGFYPYDPQPKTGTTFGGYWNPPGTQTSYVGRGTGTGVGQSAYASARPSSPVSYAGGGGGGGAAAGPVLDPQMVEVEPPPMPNIARQGLMSAVGSGGGGWNVERINPMDTSQIGKRIYPQGGTALTQRGRVY